MAQLVESRFCRFEAPPGWQALPGVGVLEKKSSGASGSAILMENWLNAPMRAEDYAKKQAAFLQDQSPGTVLVRRDPFSRRDLVDASITTFRSVARDGTALRQQMITAIEGPLAVSLTLTSPEEKDGGMPRAFTGIVDSFAVAASGWARSIARGNVFPVAESSAPKTVKAPGLQIALPVPAGWTFDEKASVLRSDSGAEIGARRGGLPSGAADELFAEALQRYHRDPAWNPRRWDRGALPDGRAFFALEAVALASGTWVKKEPQVVREVFVEDEGMIAFRCQAADGDARAASALGMVVAGYTMLPPQERSLAVREPWWRVDLAGPWISGGGGMYALPPAPARIVSAQKLPASLPLRKFAEHAAARMRDQPDYVSTLSDQTRDVSVRGLATIQFAFDYKNQAGESVAVRACWAEGNGALYSLVARGPAGTETDRLFESVTAGLDAEGVRRGVQP